MAHYIIIFLIIAGIILWQFSCFLSTKEKLRRFKKLFPDDNSEFILSQFDSGEPRIITKHKNSVLVIVIDSINNYLHNNKGAVSDFHLIKDIVDRNSDAIEDEIDSQIPIPLYLGLVGTMAGILVGVG